MEMNYPSTIQQEYPKCEVKNPYILKENPWPIIS